MNQKKPNPAAPWLRWFFTAPLGPLGRKLGFRWVFFFTLPIPYHPLLFPALLLGLLGWSGWTAFHAITGSGTGSSTWAIMLAIALAMAVPLSIPVIAWVFMAFRAPLLQGLLFFLSMTLLALEVLSGGASPAWMVLPGAYFGLFLVQFTLGPWWLCRLEAERSRFVPLDPGQTGLRLVGHNNAALRLLKSCNVARLHVPRRRGTTKAKTYHWLRPGDAAALKARIGTERVRGWTFEDQDGAVLLTREMPRKSTLLELVVRSGAYTAPWWLVMGLTMVEARGPGVFRRYTWGPAHTVLPLPLLMLFHWTALVGKSQAFVGFPRRLAATLDPPECENGSRELMLFAPRGADGGTYDLDGLTELHAEVDRWLAERAEVRRKAIAELPAFWSVVASRDVPTLGFYESYKTLEDQPELLSSEQVPIVLDWLEEARDRPDMDQVHAAARLLSAFPDALLADHSERLSGIFRSKKLALQWDLHRVEDRKKLPKDSPLFAGSIVGYGLSLIMPEFYRRLATICPDLRNVEAHLKREMETQSGIRKGIAMVVSSRSAKARKRTPRPSP